MKKTDTSLPVLTRIFHTSQSAAWPKPMNTALSLHFDQSGMDSYSPDQNPASTLSHQLFPSLRCENHEISGLKLIGLTCRTSLQDEMNSSSAKIPGMLQHYFGNQSSKKIPHRLKPGVTYCVYTKYESDYTGEYDYFVGEVVSSFDQVPEGFSQLTIPAQRYAKITAGPGAMPQVCIQAWQEIWAASPQMLGGDRNYFADFEVYDERAADPATTTLDIYVGIKIS